MSVSSVSVTPPRWSQQLLHAWLPNDAMRDAIVGDLHEEFVRDAALFGADRARIRYRLRVAGIIAYVVIDAARFRTWTSTQIPATTTAAVLPTRSAPRGVGALVGRGDMGLIAAAFGVLGVGIVVNTVLFSTVRHAPRLASSGSGAGSALGVAALLLALGSAGVAAIMLCVGPRWLRRRACRQAAAQRDALERSGGAALTAFTAPDPHS